MVSFGKVKSICLIFVISCILVLTPSNVFKASSAPAHFTYGVASGDVTSNSAVLWAHVDKNVSIHLEVSRFPTFDVVDFKDSTHATADNDFTAKIIATGLKANTEYHYRWRTGDTFSDIGSFRTAPVDTQSVGLNFSWSGDTDASKITGKPYFGDWKALQAVANEFPDFFIYLGDVIYSDLRANKPPKQLDDSLSLSEFRQRYKDSRDVASLRELLKKTSIYALWDDHEVRNDWSGQTVGNTIYEIAKKSFNEYIPIQEPWAGSDPKCSGPTQFRVKHWGMNLDVVIIDTRSCRSPNAQNACLAPIPGMAGKLPDPVPTLPSFIRVGLNLSKEPPPGCLNTIKDPHRTMLGITQKTMFENALLHSKAKFKFVISSVNIQQTYTLPYDSWEGYAAERSEILNFIRTNAIKNVIFLSTDSHLNLMNEVFIDRFTDPERIAYEFVTGPIAALTEEKNLKALGAFYHKDYLTAKKYLLMNVVNADCGNLDMFSFGNVNITSNGLLKIILKDENGKPLVDELHPGGSTCVKTFLP